MGNRGYEPEVSVTMGHHHHHKGAGAHQQHHHASEAGSESHHLQHHEAAEGSKHHLQNHANSLRQQGHGSDVQRTAHVSEQSGQGSGGDGLPVVHITHSESKAVKASHTDRGGQGDFERLDAHKSVESLIKDGKLLDGKDTAQHLATTSGHYDRYGETEVGRTSQQTVQPGDSKDQPAVSFADRQSGRGPSAAFDGSKTLPAGADASSERNLLPSERTAPTDRTAESPKIKVVFEDLNQDPNRASVKPDFVIQKDGKVQVLNDPEKNPHGEIVIQVARESGQIKPTDEQQKSVDSLVSYLDDRLKQLYPDSTRNGVNVEDNQGLVSDGVKHGVARQAAPSDNFSPETHRQMENMSRFGGGGHGTMSRKEAGDYFPERTVPQQKNESEPVMAMKDAIAGMFNADKAHPYETVRRHADGSYRVGRYGLSHQMISSWLMEMLGDPPDWSKLDKLIAEGKLPKELGQKMKDPKFQEGFKDFVGKLKGGNGDVTAADVSKFLPKELQETIGTDLVKDFAHKADLNPGKVALGFALDKSPDKLTEADLSNPENKQYMLSAQRLFGLAQARQLSDDKSVIEWDGSSPMGAKIAQVAEHTARNMGTVGWCARGVETALSKLGVHFSGNAADTRGFFENDPRFKRVDLNHLQPGDVVVRGRSAGHQWGHIFVYLGNGMEASDHVQQLTDGSRYGPSAAFRMVTG